MTELRHCVIAETVIVNENPRHFLEDSEFIDWQEPEVYKKAIGLADGCESKEQIARACYEFVRDEIQHSWDYHQNAVKQQADKSKVTCKASEVLAHGTGFCFAKSHLLAALLRANGIPAALCYQRLADDENASGFCLHGLNAVYLDEYDWCRLDARGNKTGVSAQFTPPQERLAFSLALDGEEDVGGLYAEPLPSVVEVLSAYDNVSYVAYNLPDTKLD